ncbi:DUF1062 domain-containing protein [Aestuariivita sp.]|uniref:DUF1062 domain-containing protein n=1 Tax=Aestuariivita sp. TaxID=1872407 RepID=UPI002171EEF9|nr:DUF1062 domain-containing protein [Aestuariivita sp.]MCE8008933.1 DUF1062 domain-containing protein [Aestuariivita sp.]
MTGAFRQIWVIQPTTPPGPLRHCATCGTTRPFHPSGKVRLNANGRKLDAWLIYKCTTCDRTWNCPVYERVTLSDLASQELDAMHLSAPAWVWRHANDLSVLRRHCDRIETSAEVTVQRSVADGPSRDWSILHLDLRVPCPTGCRLDRLLAREVALSRAGLRAMVRTGGLRTPKGAKGLRHALTGDTWVAFVARDLHRAHRDHLTRVLCPGPA